MANIYTQHRLTETFSHVKNTLKKQAFVRNHIVPLWWRSCWYWRNRDEPLHRVRLRRLCILKQKFIDDVRNAVEHNVGYAAGKLGLSQKHWMYYPILLGKASKPHQLKSFENDLVFHGLKQVGIFPGEPSFYLTFNEFYMEAVRRLDCIGIVCYPAAMEMKIIQYYGLKSDLIHYPDQEPDHSSPSDDRQCYLKYFRDKRLLLVCPFAELLKERANKTTFEGVWAKTGKKWFYPKSVDALEFPYGFSPETHRRYINAINLYDDITARIKEKPFDIALIAAGGLAIPLAAFVKGLGKVGIDMGGHLQVLFGVIGKRWRTRENHERLFTPYWIDMPSKYKPKETDVCDRGAYW
jgi:hypothetical protein